MVGLPASAFDDAFDRAMGAFLGGAGTQYVDIAIRRARELLTLGQTPHERAVAHTAMATAQIARCQVTRDPDDIDLALDMVSAAVSGGLGMDLQVRLMLLALELTGRSLRFELLGDPADLDAVISAARAAEPLPRGFPVNSTIRNLLGGALANRFMMLRDPADLEPASLALREAIGCATSELESAAAMNNLALVHHERYESFGDPHDVERALELTNDVVTLLRGMESDVKVSMSIATAECTRARSLATRWRFYGHRSDIDEAISLLESRFNVLPDDHPGVANVMITLATVLSDAAHNSGDVDTASEGIELYRAALEFAAPGALGAASAMTNLIGLLILRAELAGSPEDLDEALQVHTELTQGSALEELDAVFTHNLALLLSRRFDARGDVRDLQRALELHEQVASSDYEGVERDQIYASYAETLLSRWQAFGDEADRERAIEIIQAGLERRSVTLRRVAQQRELCTLAVSAARWELGRSVAQQTLSDVESVLGALDPNQWEEWLVLTQGVCSLGAYAAAQLGDLPSAVSLLERGCGVQAAGRISQQKVTLRRARSLGFDAYADAYEAAAEGVHLILSMERRSSDVIQPMGQNLTSTADELTFAVAGLAVARAALEDRVGPLAPIASIGELLQFVAESGSELTYVVTTFVGGMRLHVTPPGLGAGQAAAGLRVEWLPDLVEEDVIELYQSIYEIFEGDEGEERAASRGFRGSAAGPDAHLVVDAVRALSRVLIDPDGPAEETRGTIRAVPVGLLGLIPIAPALADALSSRTGGRVAVSVAGSGLLHRSAYRNAQPAIGSDGSAPRIAAITSPRPCDWNGEAWPPLPAAAEEGDELARRYGAHHLTGEHATAEALVSLFSGSDFDIVHLATHGHVSAADGDLVRILLANTPGGEAGTVSEADLPSQIGCPSVFLACCWLAHNSTLLPDEAAGFPTWLIQSGAARVIAPLWPVNDRAALILVTLFYQHWLLGGLPATLALARARADVHDAADRPGAGDERWRAALRATADAFVVTGD